MGHDALIDLAGPGLLRRAVAGMTREQLLARPIPGNGRRLGMVKRDDDEANTVGEVQWGDITASAGCVS